MSELHTSKARAKFRELPIWQMFRRWLLQHKKMTCEFCGVQYKDIKQMNIHHRYTTQYTNLATERFHVLCKTCHEFIHLKYNSPKFKDGLWYGLKD